MDPILLGPSAHYYQIAGPGFERVRGASGAGLNQKPTCRTQCEHGDDTPGLPTGETIAVPSCAVLSIAIEIQPKAVVLHAVMFRQCAGGIQQGAFRYEVQVRVARRQTGFAKCLLE